MCVLSIKVPIQKKSGNLFNDPRIYIYVYISYSYVKKKKKKKRKLKKIIIQELPQKKAVLFPIKSSSDDDPGFRHGFGAEASLPLTQYAPAVSHNTTRLYWMMFDLYECHIRSDAVTVLFWSFFFIYSLFFDGESLSLVKNVGVAIKIKPRHLISRGNMPVDQLVLIQCSRRSSYFSNFRGCTQSMLALKGIVNSAMITFLN